MSAQDEPDRLMQVRLETGRTVEEELRQFDQLATLLDSKFSLFGFRFGIDSLLGLIPVVGDISMGLAGMYALGHAFRLKLPLTAKIHIIWNLVFDTLLGAIPGVGDIFDFFFRSNTKNLRVVQKHLKRRAERELKRARRQD